MPRFNRYIGIDYSGAQTATSSLKGLRVYESDHDSDPREVPPTTLPKWYWTRKAVAEWLLGELKRSEVPMIVGIDHAFSFPMAYFEKYGIEGWDQFLSDFCDHWPTHEDHVYVDFVRKGICGQGSKRMGNSKWRRLTEKRARTAKSVFQFDMQGSVAKSTHSGIPWLKKIRQDYGLPMQGQSKLKLHFWPFDGWIPEPNSHVIAEIYPSLWSRSYPKDDRTPDQQDAYASSRALKEADLNGALNELFAPRLLEGEGPAAAKEGWILGVR